MFASYLIRLRVKTNRHVLPDYLNLFLNSSLGIRQIRRLSRRAVNQANVNAEELKGVKVAVLPLPAQREVKELSDKSFAQFEMSKSLYVQAERVVLDALRWDSLDLSQPKWWSVPLSKARDVRRLDADHFQPKYDKLIAHIKATGRAKPLGEIAAKINRGLQPAYSVDGEVLVFTEKHLGRFLLNVDEAERSSMGFWKANPKARVHKGDIVLYSIGAYIGRANVFMEDRKAVTSSNVTIIRPDAGKVIPEYLAAYLNLEVGALQARKWTASVGQTALYPADVSKFWIYLPSDKFQTKVADLVRQSYQARQKARALLNVAKAKVEALIENMATKAGKR